ncbi:MAG: UDP-2,3-diacylglucosamine diphosphatase [Chitinispirillales bacterium]|jgi:UDP-2,3-diacylglucosamine hydrolase|nr:UDP-2,3-diacylglucosamine diphosphatase [Chitinispirillales bacterium]
MVISNRSTVYFISDAHFGLGADDDRVEVFTALAVEMRECAAALYIVGDLFDFWIEYRCAIRPDYFLVLHTLRGLVEAGVNVCYVTGNHDFAIGSFLEDTTGITVHRGGVDTVLQGRRLYISHGDRAHKNGVPGIIDRLLRNRFLQALYKMIHPNIGVKLGMLCSAMLKKRSVSGHAPEKDLEKCRQAARARLKTGECDLVIFAHTHYAELLEFDGGQGQYCNTGSWMGSRDYATLRDGKIQLHRRVTEGRAL